MQIVNTDMDQDNICLGSWQYIVSPHKQMLPDFIFSVLYSGHQLRLGMSQFLQQKFYWNNRKQKAKRKILS